MTPTFNWNTLPKEVQPVLLGLLDGAWNRRQSDAPVLGPQDRSKIMDQVGYILQMYWLSRTDKFDHRYLPVFAALSQALVPAQWLDKEDKPPYDRATKNCILFIGANHKHLAHEVLGQVIDAYVIEEKLAPPAPRRGLMSRLF